MNKRLVSLGFVTLTFLMFISMLPTHVAAVKPAQNEEVVIYGMPYDFSEFSVYTADSYATAQWVSAVYGSLLKRSSANNRDWAPDLAKAMPTVSNNGLTFTFVLRDNLYFSNGKPLTTDDIEFSFKMAMTPEVDLAGYSTYSQYLSNDSFTAISTTSFSMTLTQSYAFPYGLLSFAVVPQETYGKQYQSCLDGVVADCAFNNPDGSSAISAGPFKVSDIDSTNQIVTVVANSYWYDAANVKTDKIIFEKIADKAAAISALSDGSINIMDSQYVPGLNELKGISGIKETFVGDPATQEISVNNFNPYFGTGMMIPDTIKNGATNKTLGFENAITLRHAMSAIVDRDSFVTQIMQGLAEPAATNMPSASLGWDPTVKPEAYNVTYAKELMTGLGFNYTTLGAPDANGVYSKGFFNITVLSPNTNGARNQWSDAYSAELPKLGIQVTQHVSTGWAEIVPRTFGSSVEPPSYKDGGYDIFFVGYGWSLDWNPSGLYDSTGDCTTGDCSNFYNFDLGENMTQIAAHVRAYLTELDFDARLQKVSVVQQDIAHYLPAIGILYPQSHWSWTDDVLGVDPLLISTSSQEWNLVYRTGFQNNKAETPKTGGNGPLPFNSTYFVAGLLASVMAVYSIRKRRY
jgi:ABC-type transport system substrate-binding protein